MASVYRIVVGQGKDSGKEGRKETAITTFVALEDLKLGQSKEGERRV